MFILSGDKRTLINCSNIANISIKNGIDFHDKKWWKIIVMYPAVSNDILYDTLCKYDTENLCIDDFNKLCCRIASGRENEIIDMNDL